VALVTAARVGVLALESLNLGGDEAQRVRGWDHIGARVARAATAAPYSCIVTDERELMGALLFYARPRPAPVKMWPWLAHPVNHYDLATPLTAADGGRVLLVTAQKDPSSLLARAARSRPLGPHAARLDAQRTRTVYLFDCENMRP